MDTIENVGNEPPSTEREQDMSFPRKESWRLHSESKGPCISPVLIHERRLHAVTVGRGKEEVHYNLHTLGAQTLQFFFFIQNKSIVYNMMSH